MFHVCWSSRHREISDEENSVSSSIVNNILIEIFTDLNVNGPGGLGKCQGT